MTRGGHCARWDQLAGAAFGRRSAPELPRRTRWPHARRFDAGTDALADGHHHLGALNGQPSPAN